MITAGPARLQRVFVTVLSLSLSVVLCGCSIISPMPLWEFAKATGTAASVVIGSGPSQASDTVYHPHPAISSVCIELNPQTPVADLLPALQNALREHQIESRVYAERIVLAQCEVWLRYVAYVQWEIPPFSETYKPYVSSAVLSLQAASGKILASSHYDLERNLFGTGKWASTRSKLSPVVTALVTGAEP